MEVSDKQQNEINAIAGKYDLRFIIIYGSYARGKEKPGSDLDVAILGKDAINSEDFSNIYVDLGNIFGNNSERELDIKLLNRTNSLFRFQVVKDGMLVFGDETEYAGFRAYAFRDYVESEDLFKLKRIFIQKRMEYLKA